VVDKNDNRLIERRDIVHLTVLVAIALVIGVYLIATTVLIAKDGVYYIERAQQFSSNPIQIIKAHTPGYPFLILMGHKLVALFTDSISNQTWIYAAQSITLLCRLLALIPLYFIGKLLVGGKNSFWALIILIFLPYPTRIVCDIVREWPYILFLATGFLFLLLGARYGRWWAFGLVGLISGLGYLIRPEAALLVLYGLGWLIINLFCGINSVAKKYKLICGGVLLVAGFTIFAGPHMKLQGQIVPESLKELVQSSKVSSSSKEVCQELPSPTFERKIEAVLIPTDILRAFGCFINSICETVMYLFVPPLLVGYSHYFRRKGWLSPEKFYMSMFTFLTVLLFILVYCKRGRNSARHILPLVSLTIFFIPVGLQIIVDWFRGRLPKDVYTPDMRTAKEARWFYSIIIIGIIICMPKLLKPIRIEKQGYRETAAWLNENVSPKSLVVVPDLRISFYAERKGVKEISHRIYSRPNYTVKIFKDGKEILPESTSRQRTRRVHSIGYGKEGEVVVYQILRKRRKEMNGK